MSPSFLENKLPTPSCPPLTAEEGDPNLLGHPAVPRSSLVAKSK